MNEIEGSFEDLNELLIIILIYYILMEGFKNAKCKRYFN